MNCIYFVRSKSLIKADKIVCKKTLFHLILLFVFFVFSCNNNPKEYVINGYDVIEKIPVSVNPIKFAFTYDDDIFVHERLGESSKYEVGFEVNKEKNIISIAVPLIDRNDYLNSFSGTVGDVYYVDIEIGNTRALRRLKHIGYITIADDELANYDNIVIRVFRRNDNKKEVLEIKKSINIINENKLEIFSKVELYKPIEYIPISTKFDAQFDIDKTLFIIDEKELGDDKIELTVYAYVNNDINVDSIHYSVNDDLFISEIYCSNKSTNIKAKKSLAVIKYIVYKDVYVNKFKKNYKIFNANRLYQKTIIRNLL